MGAHKSHGNIGRELEVGLRYPHLSREEETNMSEPLSESPKPVELQEPGSADGAVRPNLWMRLLFMVLIAFLMGAAQTVVRVLALVQFINMVIDKGKPNAQIADFGKGLGAWLAKAARFQTAQSEDKPWPWSPLG